MIDFYSLAKLFPVLFLMVLATSCTSRKESFPNCEPPGDNWLITNHENRPHMAIVNHIYVEPEGRFRWNGEIATLTQIQTWLVQVNDMIPRPVQQLTPKKGASCDDLLRMRNLIDNELDCEEPYSCNQGSAWVRSAD